MGIFVFALGVLYLLSIVIIMVIVPSLIIAIINLVQGIRRGWPKKNIVLLSVFGSIVATFIIGFFITVLFLSLRDNQDTMSSTSEYLRMLITRQIFLFC